MCRKYWFEGYCPKPQGGTNFLWGTNNVLQISLFEARFHADSMASEETQKKKRRTSDVCSLRFCSKRLKDNVSIHKPPKDPEIRRKWFNFVAKTRKMSPSCIATYALIILQRMTTPLILHNLALWLLSKRM